MMDWNEILDDISHVFLVVMFLALMALVIAVVGYIILGLAGFIPDFGNGTTIERVKQP